MKMRIRDSRDLRTELLKDLLFPARCPICSDIIPLSKRLEMRGDREIQDLEKLYDGLACRECRKNLSYIKIPYCKKCGKQLNIIKAEKTEGICSDCRSAIRIFEQCRCVLNYDETAREMMTEIKYHSKREYIDFLAVLAADRLGDWIRSVKPDFLIPVPVHKQRLRERGFNQAEVLAEKLSVLLRIPSDSTILMRRKNTSAQKKLGADARLMNLQDAFFCRDSFPKGARMLVIDDIYTTGATMEACAEKLLDAGAGTVYGLCLCTGESDFV